MNKTLRNTLFSIVFFIFLGITMPQESVFAETREVIIEPGQTFEITEATIADVTAGIHSYALYNPKDDGYSKGNQFAQGNYPNTYSVDKNSVLVLKNIRDDENVKIKTDGVVKPTDEPVIVHRTLKKGDSWEFKFDADFFIYDYHDQTYYNEDGSSPSFTHTVYQWYKKGVYQYGASRIVITANKEDLDVWGPYRTFPAMPKSKYPALHRQHVKAGETLYYNKFGTTFLAPDQVDFTYYDREHAGIVDQSGASGQKGFDVKYYNVSVTAKKDQAFIGPYELFYGREKVINEPKTNTAELLFLDTLVYSEIDAFEGTKLKDFAYESAPELGDIRKTWGETQDKGYYEKMSISEFVSKQSLGDWKIYKTLRRPDEGFFGAIFYNENLDRYIVSFRGSNELIDWRDNILHGLLSLNSIQRPLAEQLMRELPKELDKNKVIVTGHSLGGYLASIITLTEGYLGVTFNAPGFNIINSMEIANSPYKMQLVHHQMQNDPVGNLYTKFGMQHVYLKKDETYTTQAMESHGIVNFYQHI
ncbi:lipase family protein [Bacillus cereus]